MSSVHPGEGSLLSEPEKEGLWSSFELSCHADSNVVCPGLERPPSSEPPVSEAGGWAH